MALDPRIKVWADQIYQTDKEKFGPLIRWIKAAERTYDVNDVANALKAFLPYAKTCSAHWWPYLDRVLEKIEGDRNARNSEADSNRHKTEIGEIAEALYRGIRARQATFRRPPR